MKSLLSEVYGIPISAKRQSLVRASPGDSYDKIYNNYHIPIISDPNKFALEGKMYST